MMRKSLGFAAVALLSLCACGSSSDSSPQNSDTGASGSGGTANTGGSGGVSGGGGANDGGSDAAVPMVGAVRAEKVDLLFLVDNSASMADKQMLLAKAVPDIVGRFVNPKCIDAMSGLALSSDKQPLIPSLACPDGAIREFVPVTDMHIGVISSSLGSVGGDVCSQTGSYYTQGMDDMSHLLDRDHSGGTVATWQNKGFLNWDPASKSVPPGETDAIKLNQSLTQLVMGVGETGCGYEASLEAIYRFLVDPAPYASIQPIPDSPNKEGVGVDQTVLSQRAEFLRPDSLVSIVMLTDENDCSIMVGGQGYLMTSVANGFSMPRATSACDTNPTSPDCKSCGEAGTASDPNCKKGAYTKEEDPPNLRCYRQKQRFGIDFLYPVDRYVKGFSQAVLDDGRVNPLFCSKISENGKSCLTTPRDPTLVVLTGIVGVPWQDLARNPKDLSAGYLSGSEVQWDKVIGDPENFVDPADPFMIESINPRSGSNPFSGDSIGAAGTTNAINGHERSISAGSSTGGDLQYTCVFDLPTARDCSADFCDCDDANNPLCQNPVTGASDSTRQYRAKAYPGIRQLSVIRGLGTQGVAASICAKDTSDVASAIFGYRPAVITMQDRLAKSLQAPTK